MTTWTKVEIRELKIRYTSYGESDQSIAKALGRSIGSVSNCRQKYNIQRPIHLRKYRPWTTNELNIVTSMSNARCSLSDIAKKINRTAIAVKRCIDEKSISINSATCTYKDLKTYNSKSEKWKFIAGTNEYAVSSIGRVMSFKPRKRGKILKYWTDKDGYNHVHLNIRSSGKRYSIHQLVAKSFLGERPSTRHQVAHNDGNSSNNFYRNLRWATSKENQGDRLRHGTAMIQINAARRKLGNPTVGHETTTVAAEAFQR